MSSSEASPEHKQAFKVEDLAEALLRLSLPETENIVKITSSKLIESDQGRHEVANRLAAISRRHQHQLKEVIQELNREMGGLDRVILNCLVFMNRATEHWQKASPLDPFVKKALLRRRYILAALLLDQPEFVLDPTHPVNQLLGAVEKLFLGWEEQQGQPPVFVTKALASLTRLLDADHCLQKEEQILARDTLFKEWEKEEKRRKNLETRLVQTEEGVDNAVFAQSQAEAVLHRFAHGKPLPEVIIQLFDTVWMNALRKVVIHSGTEAKQFVILQKLTDRIVFCYRGQHTAEQKKRLLDYAAQLVDELERQLQNLQVASEQSQQIFDAMQGLMVDVIKDSEIERRVYQRPAPEIASSQPDANLGRLEAYKGMWFKRFGKVCKFLTVLPRSGKILWSDFNGRKAGMEESRQFFADLEAKKVERFSARIRIQDIFLNVAKEIVELDVKVRKEFQEELEREKEIRKAARLKAEAEAKAILKAKDEAAAKLAKERQEIEEKLRREKIEAAERAKLEGEKSARMQIDTLPIGGWVMLEKAGQKVKCKLGVRLNATSKLIFVDSFGMKIGEFLREDAVNLLIDNKLEILGEGAEFEDRLSRAVGRVGIAKR